MSAGSHTVEGWSSSRWRPDDEFETHRFFVTAFGALFGRHYVHLTRAEQLVGHFNGHLSAKVLVFADEAIWAGGQKHLGALKGLITEPTIQIERKGIDVLEEANNLHLITATNSEWAAPVGWFERRWFVLDVSDARMQQHDYFDAMRKELDGGGREALLAFLQAQDLSGFDVWDVPKTEALAEQQEFSMDSKCQWWKECLTRGAIEDLGWPKTVLSQDLPGAYFHWCAAMQTRGRVASMQLMAFLKPYLGPSRLTYTRARRDRHGGRCEGTVSRRVRVRGLVGLDCARGIWDTAMGTHTAWPEPEECEAEEPLQQGF